MAWRLISTLPVAFACSRPEAAEVDDVDDTAVSATEREISGVDRPGDLNPVEAQTMVDDVTIGRMVSPDGTIASADQSDDFAPGESVLPDHEGRRRAGWLGRQGRVVRPR
jgi:hypothetical protein